jgi:periplasmic protein TonB
VPPSANAAPVEAPAGITPEPETAAPDDADVDRTVIAGGDPGPLTPVVAEEPPVPAQPAEPLRVGGAIRPPQKTLHVAPVYPPIALASRISGVVILEAVIAEGGTVQDVRVLRSPALLAEAAVDAVRRWKFTPTLLNGQPVAIVMTVSVAFTLR